MRVKKYFGIFAAVLLAAVLTAGCAGEDGRKDNGREGNRNSGSDTADTGLLQIEGEQLYMGEYSRLLLKDPIPVWEYQDKLLYADACDGTIYILAEYRSGEGADISRQFFLTTYSSGVTELTWQPFALDFPEKSQWYIQSLAMPGEGELSFRVLETGDNGESRYFLALTDMEGNILSLTEPFPEEEEYIWNPKNARIGDHVARGADGSVVMCKNEGEQTVFYACNPESGSRDKIKVSAEVQNVHALYSGGNVLYFVDNTEHLFRWDNKAKKLTEMMALQEINFPMIPDYAFIMPGGPEKLLLCSLSEDMLQIFSLSEEEYQPEDEIRMANLRVSNSDYILSTATEYSYAHWNCPISTESAEEQADAFRNRIMAEIAAGKGPDLMLVSADDMVILAEKGVLLDLTELIPAETMEQLFPCVIQDGTVDGKMVGLTTNIMIDTMFTADVTWPGESWSLDEFLQLLEENEEWERPIQEYNVPITPMTCLKALLPNLCHSDFLNLEAGTARFDSEGFIKIMEICKQYNDTRNDASSGAGGRERVLNQECAASAAWILDFDVFSEYASEYDGKGHLVGYPAEGSGHFIWPHFSYLVVNADSEHKEEIRDYIALLLDYDQQLYGCHGIGFSVRRDVVRDSVVMVEGMPKEIWNISGKAVLADVRFLKSDGTTYLEEFLELLEKCEAGDKWPSEIKQILEEELEPYFRGDKSAPEAAGLIQNRVQLYLDER